MSTLMERLFAGLIAGATLIGVGMACVAYGHSNGKDTNDGLVNYLREKNQEFEKTEVQLRSEVSSLKLELQGAKGAALWGHMNIERGMTALRRRAWRLMQR